MKINIQDLKEGMIIQINNRNYYVIEITEEKILQYGLNAQEIRTGFYGLNGWKPKDHLALVDDIRNYNSVFSLFGDYIETQEINLIQEQFEGNYELLK